MKQESLKRESHSAIDLSKKKLEIIDATVQVVQPTTSEIVETSNDERIAMKLDELVLFAPGVEIFNLLTAMRVQSRKIVLNLRQLRDIFSDEGRSVMQKFFDQQQEVQDLVIRSFEQNFAFFSDSLKDKKLQSLAVVVVVINRYDDEDPIRQRTKTTISQN